MEFLLFFSLMIPIVEEVVELLSSFPFISLLSFLLYFINFCFKKERKGKKKKPRLYTKPVALYLL